MCTLAKPFPLVVQLDVCKPGCVTDLHLGMCQELFTAILDMCSVVFYCEHNILTPP